MRARSLPRHLTVPACGAFGPCGRAVPYASVYRVVDFWLGSETERRRPVNQQISLSKSDGSALSAVRIGLGWQAAQRKGILAKLAGLREIDLYARRCCFPAGSWPMPSWQQGGGRRFGTGALIGAGASGRVGCVLLNDAFDDDEPDTVVNSHDEG
ncbi:hypothetical protein ACWEQN_43675 [Streptomyces sp. NPDC004129]